MKSILAIALISTFVAAEVPSNSYLPPPPNRGYPQASAPTIVAARALDQGRGDHHGGHHAASAGVNGFARSGLQSHDQAGHSHGDQARFSGSDDQGYDNNAAGFSRNALDDANASVSYEAGERSFKSQASYEDSEDFTRSGYDADANNFRANNGYHGNDQDGAHGNARSNGYN